jgi:hypothetical protein
MSKKSLPDERDYSIRSIRQFLDGSGGEWDWDNFTSCPLHSRDLDGIRRKAASVDLPLDDDGRIFLEDLLGQAEAITA